MPVTYRGPQFDSVVALISPHSDDPGADATYLLDSNFTPDLLKAYLEIFSFSPDCCAASLVALDKAGVSPTDLEGFTSRGYKSASEVARIWTASAQLRAAGVGSRALAAAALAPSADYDISVAQWLWFDAVASGYPSVSWEEIMAPGQDLPNPKWDSSPGSLHSRNAAAFGSFFAAFGVPDREELATLHKLVGSTAFRANPEVVADFLTLHRAGAPFLTEMALGDAPYCFDWLVLLRKEFPAADEGLLSPIAFGAGRFEVGDASRARVTAVLARILEACPLWTSATSGLTKVDYSFVMQDEPDISPSKTVELGALLADPEAKEDQLDKVTALVCSRPAGLTPDAGRLITTLLVSPRRRAHFADAQAWFAAYPDFTSSHLLHLLGGRLPSSDGLSWMPIDALGSDPEEGWMSSRESSLRFAERLADYRDLLPEVSFPDSAALLAAGLRAEAAAALARIFPTITVAQLVALYEVSSFNHTLSLPSKTVSSKVSLVSDADLATFHRLNPEVSIDSIIGMFADVRAEWDKWLASSYRRSATKRPKPFVPESLGRLRSRNLGRWAASGAAQVEASRQWLDSFAAGCGWESSVSSFMSAGHAGSPAAAVVSSDAIAAAAARVDVVKQEFIKEASSFDTLLYARALTHREFPQVSALLVSFVDFEDAVSAANRGKSVDVSAAAASCEAALAAALEAAYTPAAQRWYDAQPCASTLRVEMGLAETKGRAAEGEVTEDLRASWYEAASLHIRRAAELGGAITAVTGQPQLAASPSEVPAPTARSAGF